MIDRSAGRASDPAGGGELVPAAGKAVRSDLWLGFLLVGAAAVGLYYAPILDRREQALEYLAIELLAVAAVFAGLRLNPPARPLAWACFGAGMASLAMGDAIWYWLSLVMDVSPASSLADVFYLAEYPLLIAGLILLVPARPDRAVVLDTLMITTGVAVVMLEFVVRPSVEGYTGSALDLAVLVAYPLADVVLLAVAIRFAFVGNLRSPVLLLILAGLASTFVADVFWLWISQVNPDFDVDGSLVDAGWMLSMIVWGAAALHPAARSELAANATDWMRHGKARALLLAVALMLLPATMAVEVASGATANAPAFLVGWGVMVVLVLMRMGTALSIARQSEERFRIIFDDSPAGMAIARRGVIVLANHTIRAMFGVDRSDVQAKSVTDFVAPDYRQDLAHRIAARVGGAGVHEQFETIGLRSDGSEFPLVVGTEDIRLPDGAATIAFLLDVSAQKAAEDTLRASERRYRDLFESNPHPMWIYDEATLRFLAVNDAAVKQYGWSADEFRAMTIADIRPPEDVAILMNHLEVDGPGLRPPRTVRHRHADGSTVQVEVSSHTLTWDGRRARVVLAIDITDRVNLEEQLRQAQKMEAVGRLAGGVAHDFNNLLTAISGYAQILRVGFDARDSRRADVDEIILAGERAAALTRQLLAFSRRQVLQPREINLNDSIQELRGMLVRVIGEDIDLEIVLCPDLGLVRADPGQMTQVLLNLAANAKDAMPRGGKLTLETRNVVLDEPFTRTHSGVRPGRHVMLRVGDTGSGIDPETRSHLFEPFFTTKDIGKGTGLGLATVYGIVRQSEGSIDVHSELGRGSIFEICLPEAAAARQPEAIASAIESLPTGSETILVVEDEDAVRKLAVSVLARQGFSVLAADGPTQALNLVSEHLGPIDLLLTDVVMPGGNGVDLAAAISAMRPQIKVVVMTGYAQEQIASQGVLKEGIVLLEKPFSPNLLLSRVRLALDADARAEVA
jgi:two-component system, cell cycle sensor histidine kinase and response regulator CckA